MIDLGTVRPGSTIRIPFATFDKDDGSSITMTNFAAADLLVYKDGSTTERASTAGFTATTDFDGKTGKHVAVIDLADDTTADFWKAGSEYLVFVDAVTVDTVTTGGCIARFRIGYPHAYFDTSIATLASQTSFTLTAGPAEDDALNGMVLLVHDKASAVQVTRVVVEDYTGASKTVTLRAAPATTFTIAAGDNVSAVGFDAVNLTHASGTAVTWSATRGLAGTALPAAAADAAGGLPTRTLITDARLGALDDWLDGGRLDLILDIIAADTTTDIPALLATIAGYLDTEIAAIKVKTDALPADPADASDVAAAITAATSPLATAANLAAAKAVVDAIKAVTDLLPNGGALTSLATAAAVAAAAADIATLLTRLSSARAGYLDNLSGGAAALEATLTAIKGGSWSTETLVAIAARLPAALTAGGYMKSDALAINGATAAAVRLALSAGVIVPGTVDSTAFTPTTTVFEADDITTAAADHYIGRVIVFTSGTLINQATTITDYALTSGRGRFTVDTLTSAPANNDTFVIV